MKQLSAFLFLATNGNSQKINPIIYRILFLLTALIWIFSIIWFVYSFIISTQAYIIYNNDNKILNEIQKTIENNPRLYDDFQQQSYNGEVMYYDPEKTLDKYFLKLSFFDPRVSNPITVKINYETARKHHDSDPNPLTKIFIQFILIAFANFIWWFLLRVFFWLRFGNKN